MKLCGSVSIHSFFVNSKEVSPESTIFSRRLPTHNVERFPQKISLSNQDTILIVFKNVVTDLI